MRPRPGSVTTQQAPETLYPREVLAWIVVMAGSLLCLVAVLAS